MQSLGRGGPCTHVLRPLFRFVFSVLCSGIMVSESMAELEVDSGTEPLTASDLPNAISMCLSAIGSAQRMFPDIPPGLLLAIAQTESGRSWRDDFGPWPWTLNIAGTGQFYASRIEALTAAQSALETGEGNIDLGCMQISETWHGWAFSGLEAMLDPIENANYAAAFLTSLHSNHGNWRDAIAHYHSANPARGFAYAERVTSYWRNNPNSIDFIESDNSLAELSDLASQLSEIPELGDAEAELFVSVTVSQGYEVP